jgi:LysM repeat protein
MAAAPARPVFKPFQSNKINPRAGLTTTPKAAPKAPKAVSAVGGDYEVQSGDTVSGIARAHGIGVAALMTANNLSEDSARKLRVGQKLVIPGGSAASGTVAAAKPEASAPTTPETAAPEAVPPAAAAPETTPEMTMTAAPAGTPAATAAQAETFSGEAVIVEVEKDTTLDAYARERGFKPAVLRQLNKDMISDENLKAGQILFVPES